MTEATRDLFMEWFQRVGTTLRDDEYEGVIEALAERDRQVAERAWDACVASMKYEDGSPVEIVASVNPYRAAKGEQK